MTLRVMITLTLLEGSRAVRDRTFTLGGLEPDAFPHEVGLEAVKMTRRLLADAPEPEPEHDSGDEEV